MIMYKEFKEIEALLRAGLCKITVWIWVLHCEAKKKKKKCISGLFPPRNKETVSIDLF